MMERLLSFRTVMFGTEQLLLPFMTLVTNAERIKPTVKEEISAAGLKTH